MSLEPAADLCRKIARLAVLRPAAIIVIGGIVDRLLAKFPATASR
jgi:hypothetical protein